MKSAVVAAGSYAMRGACPFGCRNAAARSRVAKLTVLYDGACNLCRSSVERVRQMDPRGLIELVDLHDASVPARFPR